MADVRFDAALIRHYDRPGPRYTSYPSAPQFSETFDETSYRRRALISNNINTPKPLSLYIHIPFCQSLCFYCGCNKIITRNKDKAVGYLDYLKREIAMQAGLFDIHRPVQQLHFGGGTPTFLEDDQLTSLMDFLEQHFNFAAQAERSIEVDPRTVTPDAVAALARMGFNRMSLGIQDFDPRVQVAVNRIQSPRQTQELVIAARAAGFASISFDLIYGLPLQTLASFATTLDTVIRQRPDRLAVYSYAHLPHLIKSQRLIKAEELPSPDTKLALLELTIRRLTEAGYVYIGMDHFALADDSLAIAQRRGTLQRNFQGYSTCADTDLIGLGVSAIGSLAGSYSQNTRYLKAYYEKLDAGQLPIMRGLELSADDQLRRDIINRIMCSGQLDCAQVERDYGILFRQYFDVELRRLVRMENDGLIEWKATTLMLTPLGRLLLRNVCMVFDRYLRPSETHFSRTV